MIDQTIGQYKITSKLGQGGMGEVYRATDTKLDRDVAIKVLPENVATQAERLSRFKREAKVLAALNHPNVATLYGFDADQGRPFLVMEFVRGNTLEEELSRGALTLTEKLEIFSQIAKGLAAAHQEEVIHRDLKPANVIIGPEGQAKVLDFGLAKALEQTLAPTTATSATVTCEQTLPGKVMGTPAYMSPEQARGLEVDERTDAWAFGCCLFEALTGQLPFQGQTSSDILAAILKTDPDFSLLPAETPSELVTLLRRCLEKDPRRRLRHLGDIALTLEDAAVASRSQTHEGRVLLDRDALRSKSVSWWGKLLAFVVGIVVLALGYSVVERSFLSSGTQKLTIRSLAVLPFENVTTDPELNGLDRFIQNALLAELRKVPELETANMPAKINSLLAAQKTELEMAKELAVDGLVIGNVTQHGNDISVLVSVVNGTTGREVVGETIMRPHNELSSLPNDAALAIVDSLKIGLQAADRERIATPGTRDRAAFLAFQQGLELFDRRLLPQAEEKFDKAVEMDPSFAEADAYAFNAELIRAFSGAGRHPGEVFEKRTTKLENLPERGADDAVWRLNQMWWELVYRRDWKQFRSIYWHTRNAGRLTGEDLTMMSLYLSLVEGRLDESLELMNDALRLEPDRVMFKKDQVYRLHARGENNDALQLIEQFDPAEVGLESFFHVYIGNEQFDRATELAKKIYEQSRSAEAFIELARIDALQKRSDEARTRLDEVEGWAKDGKHVPYAWVARAYGSLGDMDDAFRWLNAGLNEGRGDFSMVTIRIVNMLKLFSQEPRYWEIVDAIALPSLPVDHPYYQIEMEMRFGKSSTGLAKTGQTSGP